MIIGLDISLSSPGWCRIDTETKAVTFDTLNYSKLQGMERIATAAKDLVELCRPADLVVTEGLSMGLPMGKNGPFVPQGRSDLIGLTYILRLWLWKAKRITLLIPPTTLKKWTTGSGKSDKSLMIREVTRRWGVEVADDNQADAVALAEFGRAYLEPAACELTKYQMEALKKAATLHVSEGSHEKVRAADGSAA